MKLEIFIYSRTENKDYRWIFSPNDLLSVEKKFLKTLFNKYRSKSDLINKNNILPVFALKVKNGWCIGNYRSVNRTDRNNREIDAIEGFLISTDAINRDEINVKELIINVFASRTLHEYLSSYVDFDDKTKNKTQTLSTKYIDMFILNKKDNPQNNILKNDTFTSTNISEEKNITMFDIHAKNEIGSNEEIEIITSGLDKQGPLNDDSSESKNKTLVVNDFLYEDNSKFILNYTVSDLKEEKELFNSYLELIKIKNIKLFYSTFLESDNSKREAINIKSIHPLESEENSKEKASESVQEDYISTIIEFHPKISYKNGIVIRFLNWAKSFFSPKMKIEIIKTEIAYEDYKTSPPPLIDKSKLSIDDVKFISAELKKTIDNFYLKEPDIKSIEELSNSGFRYILKRTKKNENG